MFVEKIKNLVQYNREVQENIKQFWLELTVKMVINKFILLNPYGLTYTLAKLDTLTKENMGEMSVLA